MAVDGSTQSNGQSSLQSETGSGSVMISRWRANKNKSIACAAKIGSLMPQEVSGRHVYRHRFISLMVENECPVSGGESSTDAYLTFVDRYYWYLQILNLPSLTPALENALLAMSTARLGHHEGRPALVRESLKLYTQSVAHIRRDILDKSARSSEQSLAACLTLLWYEAIECPGKTMDGYRAHYRGCLELLKMHGPGAYTTGLGHSTLQILRLHTVIVGNEPGGITFLAQPEWLDLPWSSQPDKKPLFDGLIDILLQLPSPSAQRYTSLDTATDPQRALQAVWAMIEEGQRMEDALEDWFAAFRAALPGDSSLYRAELSQIDSVVDTVEEGKLFPVAFHFSAFAVGQTLLYYWVALMCVRARLCYTYEALRGLAATLDFIGREKLPCACHSNSGCGHDRNEEDFEVETGGSKAKKNETKTGHHRCLRHFNPDLLPHLERRAEWPWRVACNICQSAEYFFRNANRGHDPARVLPALEWVRGFWQRAPGGPRAREIAWIDDMVGRIYSSGYGIAGAMLERRGREISPGAGRA